MAVVSLRTCPLCNAASIPVYRAMCGRCFPRLPWKLRADFLDAWRMRVADPLSYRECLAHVVSWYRQSHPLAERN